VPQTDPAAVFGGVADIQGWTSAASGRYELAVRQPERAAPAVARALVGAGAGADILSLSESRRSLEDVYLSLIDEDLEARRRGASARRASG
jgi:ABC-2 type transport system ATP-binding protein